METVSVITPEDEFTAEAPPEALTVFTLEEYATDVPGNEETSTTSAKEAVAEAAVINPPIMMVLNILEIVLFIYRSFTILITTPL